MTSERAKSANRRNALASTGPRTASGKQRVAQNARSHGLSVARPNAAAEAEVGRLAELIASEHGSDPEVADAARTLAESQINLARTMAVKARWIREEVEAGQNSGASKDPPGAFPSGALLQRLEQVERYERRAFSQRKSAARRLLHLAGSPQGSTGEQ
ncbi:hypothetical protein [Methylobacterium oxalidis]|uniref:hypothetical protein n=1 Tax=Methylobacterium oxalidis TaxID=944322 RepID=UPI00331472E7